MSMTLTSIRVTEPELSAKPLFSGAVSIGCAQIGVFVVISFPSAVSFHSRSARLLGYSHSLTYDCASKSMDLPSVIYVNFDVN